MHPRARAFLPLALLVGFASLSACGGDDAPVAPSTPRGGAGKAGAAGTGGKAAAGAAGASAGTGGGGQNGGGSGGSAGSAGGAGANVGGGAGASGASAGAGGATAGAAGSSAGAAGTSAGSAGSSAGAAGSSVGAAGTSNGGAGTAGASGAPACVQQSTEAKLVKRPVDVIVYLDTSDSMKPAITATEANLETNFTGLLAASGVDYRAIMLVGKKVPANPTDAARFSYLYALGGSGALHDNIVNWYDAPPADGGNAQPGWGSYLRKDAFKVILVISDTTSGPSMSAEAFDTALLAKSPEQLGTKAKRNYRYHAIMGVAQNTPKAAPWLPTDPLVQGACTGYAGGVSPNANAQQAAIQTGGLRFPLCETGSFDTVFKTIAEGEVEKAPVQCVFDIPKVPPPTIIDENTIQIRATQGASVETYSRVDDVGQCKEGSFTIAGGKVTLCPAACTVVQAEEGVKVDVLYGCKLPGKDLRRVRELDQQTRREQRARGAQGCRQPGVLRPDDEVTRASFSHGGA